MKGTEKGFSKPRLFSCRVPYVIRDYRGVTRHYTIDRTSDLLLDQPPSLVKWPVVSPRRQKLFRADQDHPKELANCQQQGTEDHTAEHRMTYSTDAGHRMDETN